MNSASKFYVSLVLIGAGLSALDDRVALACGVLGLLCLTSVQVGALLKAKSYSSFIATTFSGKIDGSGRFYAMSGLAMIVGAFLGIFIRFAWIKNAL